MGFSSHFSHFWPKWVKIGLLGEISSEISPSKTLFGILGQKWLKMFNMAGFFMFFTWSRSFREFSGQKNGAWWPHFGRRSFTWPLFGHFGDFSSALKIIFLTMGWKSPFWPGELGRVFDSKLRPLEPRWITSLRKLGDFGPRQWTVQILDQKWPQ